MKKVNSIFFILVILSFVMIFTGGTLLIVSAFVENYTLMFISLIPIVIGVIYDGIFGLFMIIRYLNKKEAK